MAAYEVYESKKPLNVPAGYYPATVSKAEEVDGQYGPQVRLSFTLDDYPDETPMAWASARVGTGTKLFKWACALLGEPPIVGSRLSPEDLIGRPCRLEIGEKATLTGGVVMAVKEILRPVAAPKAAPAVDTPPWEETPTPALADACFCGQRVESYTPEGVGLCAKHAAEAAEVKAAP